MNVLGPPRGIRTPDLQNRNLLRYPTAPWADIIIFKLKELYHLDDENKRIICKLYSIITRNIRR